MSTEYHQLNHQLRSEIIAGCLHLEELGYVVGTYGNVSARIDGGLLITPSRVDYGALTPDDLVAVSLEGHVIEGRRLPSSEMEVHRQIYCARPDVGAVVHTHSLYATALSCLHRSIPVIVEEQAQVLGGAISCSRYVPAGQHEKLGREVARALGESQAVLLANHGTLACGRTLGEALFACRVTERTAQMYLLASSVTAPVPIPPDHAASERDRYLNKYGTDKDKT